MSEWQPIETAPKYAALLHLRTAGGVELIGFWHNQLLDGDGKDCGGWAAAEESDYPPCWTDGICWERNDEGKPSDPPTHWRPT